MQTPAAVTASVTGGPQSAAPHGMHIDVPQPTGLPTAPVSAMSSSQVASDEAADADSESSPPGASQRPWALTYEPGIDQASTIIGGFVPTASSLAFTAVREQVPNVDAKATASPNVASLILAAASAQADGIGSHDGGVSEAMPNAVQSDGAVAVHALSDGSYELAVGRSTTTLFSVRTFVLSMSTYTFAGHTLIASAGALSLEGGGLLLGSNTATASGGIAGNGISAAVDGEGDTVLAIGTSMTTIPGVTTITASATPTTFAFAGRTFVSTILHD